ncbi:glycoside hydrolase family 11 protein [Hymenobacter cellulosilyticus]|uniref:endo-1,4-beta-xylanase n=1 Tax=Hymenobacter cellulosilyticus TaxID=2932248 RepID=A0A8T9Q9I8_9BACT|nr:glycoside hydrolase family 11 protein [Hymenobacter cellulosilyticus]UOQ74174.1 glycoside hydrolase family 11 protein [Hymenobacter cellulosilyticus]
MLLLGAQQTIAQTITANQIGNQGGYTYEYWKDSGTGSMTLGSGGAFSVTWSNIGNLLARKGLRPGAKNQTVTYAATYSPNGNSYLCVYGWFTSPMVEYYIVDSWGSWRPPGGTSVGTVTSDGGTYDLYRTQRVNQPSIQGTATFYQYWSVRTAKRTSGTITVANHFNAWQSRGWTVGSMYEVSLTVEGYQSSGTANVTSMSMGTSSGTTPPPTGGGGSNNIVVRARGTNGTENLRLTVGGVQVGAWTLGTDLQNYSVATSNTGGINVEYTNDATNRDVQVDYITVNGSTRQAENQSTNTGVYLNGACGGANSEWLNCNGYIGFGTTSSTGGRAALETKTVAAEVPAPRGVVSKAQVFPNPSSTGRFMVQVPAGPAQVTIRSSKGSIVQQFDATGPAAVPVQLDAKPGLYYLQVTSPAESVVTQLAVE